MLIVDDDWGKKKCNTQKLIFYDSSKLRLSFFFQKSSRKLQEREREIKNEEKTRFLECNVIKIEIFGEEERKRVRE